MVRSVSLKVEKDWVNRPELNDHGTDGSSGRKGLVVVLTLKV